MESSLRLRCVVLVAAFVACGPCDVWAQTHDEVRLGKYLLDGWQSQREQLVVGSVVMSVKVQLKNGRSMTKVSYCFDHEKGLKKAFVTEPAGLVGAWLLTPEYFAQCRLNSSPVLSVMPTSGEKLGFVRDADPRYFGMIIRSDFDAAPPFKDITDRVRSFIPKKVLKATSGAYELECDDTRGAWPVKLTATINPARGFACERLLVSSKGPGQQDWSTVATSVASWVKRNEIWVPESLVLTGLPWQETRVDLNWTSVNQPLPVDDFKIDKMGVPSGTKIVDSRLDPKTPILVGKVGSDVTLRPAPKSLTVLGYLRPMTTALVGLLIFFAIGFLIRRVVRRRASRAA
ncbi:MAG: hypothetical protein ACRC33_06450 [Gemmataceae bacterium]